jgi:hypothetical protein
MKYIYSYYPLNSTCQFKSKNSNDVLFDLLCIKLSSTILRNLNKEVGIYSDSSFINLLKDYNVELDFYIDIGEELSQTANHNLFAISKIYAASIQTEPFILLDCDMILFDSFDFNEYENKNLFFHYPELITFLSSNQLLSEKYHINEDILKYQSSYDAFINWQKTYLNQFYKISDICPSIANETNFLPAVAYNCAIYGGTDWVSLSNANKKIYDFIKNNYELINEKLNYPMVTLEQQLIAAQLINYGYSIKDMEFITRWNEFTIIQNNDEIKVNYDNLNFVFNWTNEYEDIKNIQFLNLIMHRFNGHMHLSRAKETIGVKHLIYNMLKYYDNKYIEWFELHKHNTLDFQQNIY